MRSIYQKQGKIARSLKQQQQRW